MGRIKNNDENIKLEISSAVKKYRFPIALKECPLNKYRMSVPAYGIKLNYDPGKDNYIEVSIKQLVNSPPNPILYGIVIGKSDVQCVTTKKGASRFVLVFTIRDSPNDTINASCWGEKDEVSYFKQLFTIGDVVKIKKVLVVSLRNSTAESQYKPHTTSNFELKINPTATEIEICRHGLQQMFSQYLTCPVYLEYMTLAELNDKNQRMEGLHVTLLVAIRDIGALEDVKTKDGRSLKKFQLLVYDQSNITIPVLIWSAEVATFLLKHCAKNSVLQISDIRISHNAFTKKMMATATKNTIFTPNPDMPEGKLLLQYVQQTSTSYAAQRCTPAEQGSGLQVYTVARLLETIQNGTVSAFEDTCGVLIAFLSHLDIDGHSRVISIRCPGCKQKLRYSRTHCTNSNCDIASGINSNVPEDFFDLMVNVSDHTGTLKSCSMQGQVVEDFLGCTVAEFYLMSDLEKTNLKWQFLLERAKIEFKIAHSTVLMGCPRITILSCTKLNLTEASLYNKNIF